MVILSFGVLSATAATFRSLTLCNALFSTALRCCKRHDPSCFIHFHSKKCKTRLPSYICIKVLLYPTLFHLIQTIIRLGKFERAYVCRALRWTANCVGIMIGFSSERCFYAYFFMICSDYLGLNLSDCAALYALKRMAGIKLEPTIVIRCANLQSLLIIKSNFIWCASFGRLELIGRPTYCHIASHE